MKDSSTLSVTYECDVYGNHDCAVEALSEIRVQEFTDKMEAIHFISECTSCTHDLKDVHPDLFYWEDNEEQSIASNKELEEYISNNNYLNG